MEDLSQEEEDMSRFESKVVIVTGGGSGIGAVAGRRFADEGAAVSVADVDEESANRVAREIRDAGGKAKAFRTDVSRESEVAALVDGTVEAFGGLDVMVNNAGIGEDPTPVDEKPSEDWRRIIDVNLSSAFYGTKHAVRVMKAAGRPGVIVNVASVLGVVGFDGAPAYTAAKHGMVGLTRATAVELAEHGIRVVAVSPAFIRTPLIAGLEEAVLPLHPIGRLGEPEEVASLIAYLASDEASFLTGATYLVDGGYTAR
jgi:NAD(P)-dependent dehydrogenase (short-subunit alcohol dehydrogenase family)